VKYGASCDRTRPTASGKAWTKKFKLNGRFVVWRIAATCSRIADAGYVAQPIEPRPPALQTAAASAGVVKPLIGACTIGWVIPNRSRKSVRGHMVQIPFLRRAHRFVGACDLTRLLEQGSCFGGGEGLCRHHVLDAASAGGSQ